MPSEAKRELLALRISPPRMTRRLVGALAVGVIVLFWWLATSGLGSEDRWISPVILPSPGEVIRSFPSLFKERALLQSIAATLKRVLIGFGLAVLVGVPLGIAAGAWRVIEAAGAPLALFGRNLPVAATLRLQLFWLPCRNVGAKIKCLKRWRSGAESNRHTRICSRRHTKIWRFFADFLGARLNVETLVEIG